jgi:hypothetical protein
LLTFKTSLREEEIISPIYAYTSIGAADSPSLQYVMDYIRQMSSLMRVLELLLTRQHSKTYVCVKEIEYYCYPRLLEKVGH